MSDKLNGNDIFESLTGFEEIAIAQRFGRTVLDLAGKDSTMFGRSLVFAQKRRDGANDEDAWQAAMSMPLKQVNDLVVDDESDADESGKDETPALEPEPLPETSPSSVS